jgi:splicing factor U2AF subunit
MLTRHARRIYAGGIPPRATEIEIANFFNDIVTRALAPVRPDSPPVVKVYLNTEKCYAFVEFGTVELTTACMALDGVKFDHYTGSTVVRVRRPNDYRPEMLPPPGPIPVLNVSVLGITGVGSSMGGPGKVFIGGLPYNLQDEQVMELMGAFGPIKAFHQVRDPGSVTSKGYGFCEYVNPAHAEQAIAGLNGMALGDKTLTVRIATQGASNSNNSGGGAAAAMLQQQQMMMGLGGGMGGIPGMGGMGGMGQAAMGGMGAYGGGSGAGMGGAPMSAGGMGPASAGGLPPSRVSSSTKTVKLDVSLLLFDRAILLETSRSGSAAQQHGHPRRPVQRGGVPGHPRGRAAGVSAVRKGASPYFSYLARTLILTAVFMTL